MITLIIWLMMLIGVGIALRLVIRAVRATHRHQLEVSAEQAEENARNARYRRDVERMLDPAKANEWTSHPRPGEPS